MEFIMTFGEALRAIKEGHRALRKGWDNTGMFVFLNAGSMDAAKAALQVDGVSRALFEDGDEGTVTRMPCIDMRTASGVIVTGWAPSQADMLAEDWDVIEAWDVLEN